MERRVENTKNSKILKKRIILFFICLCCSVLQAEKIRILQYNLTQYTNQYAGCSFDLFQKDSCLRQIFTYAKPDIIAVNEIGANVRYAQRILNNCLNINGVHKWAMGALTEFSSENSEGLANMVFYNSEKLQLHSSQHVANTVRDFNIYKLYLKTPQLILGDTNFLVVVVAHLKAGRTFEDATLRTSQVECLIEYLEQYDLMDNYILCGDLNIYSATEQAFQLLINGANSTVCFHDPIAVYADWHNNARYAYLHTQSTHKTQGNCFAMGGLNDRFDFILVSNAILNGSKDIRALPNSYCVLGQDGNHFCEDIISLKNELFPRNLLEALYDMSDHLPVLLDLEISKKTEKYNWSAIKDIDIKIFEPADRQLEFTIVDRRKHTYTMELLTIFGQIVYKKDIQTEIGKNTFSIDMHNLPNGIYCLRLSSEGVYTTRKIVKK